MDYTHLGRTGLRVSRLCLGTMNFGPVTEEPESHEIMDRAHEHGINFFDTANVYGWGENRGRTEQIICCLEISRSVGLVPQLLGNGRETQQRSPLGIAQIRGRVKVNAAFLPGIFNQYFLPLFRRFGI